MATLSLRSSICLDIYSCCCKSSSHEEVATLHLVMMNPAEVAILLLSSSICPDLSIYMYKVCCVSLVVMSKWPLCSSLVIAVCIYVFICASSSDEEGATLRLSYFYQSWSLHVYIPLCKYW